MNTVMIQSRVSYGVSTGTGFFVDNKKEYLLTCSHVVLDANHGIAHVFRMSQSRDTLKFDVLSRNLVKDLAVLRLRKVPPYLPTYPKMIVDMEHDNFKIGRSVATLGFLRPDLLEKRPWVTARVVLAITYPGEGEAYKFQLNVKALPGNSGGYVFTSEGYIVGMIKSLTPIEKQILPCCTALQVADILGTLLSMKLDFGWNVSYDPDAQTKLM